MNSSQLLGITTLAYLLSSALYIALFIFKKRQIGLVATTVVIIGFLVQTVGIALRWQESYRIGIGHAPFSNMFESLVFFAWCVALINIFIEFKSKNRIFGTFIIPFAFVSMAYASFSKDINQQISPLVPALQSNWLIAHVITCFIGYGAFAVAGGLGLMYLLKKRGDKNELDEDNVAGSLPKLRVIDDMTHKTILFGFLWLSAGIITGAVWANEAWGTYWSWDPKETWSLITWFIYALTLHARFTRGWGGNRIAWLAILGVVAVFVTYFGVNFWLSGLHSYG